MKIAFFSNFLNHHQLPLCKAIAERCEQFKFVACEKIPEDRIKMGYEDMNASYPFVVRAYEDADEAMRIALEYDAVIFGAAPTFYLAERMKENKLSYRFCERSLKKGAWRRFIPTTRKKIIDGYTAYKNKQLYILGASAFASADLALCGFNAEKCFKWGYFPEIKERDLDELFALKDKNEKVEILYAGRLLTLKRVIDTAMAVNTLVKRGIKNLHFTIVGEGEEKENLVQYVEKNGLSDYVTFHPFTTPEGVREYMDRADIYVFGSNFYEGWGAVMNEAMNSACAVVVSHAVGSAAYLVNNGESGYVYKCGSVEDLAQKLEGLVTDGEHRRKIALGGYDAITRLWRAEVAAERFVSLSEKILAGEDVKALYESGPVSPAGIIKNDWIKRI